MSGYTVLDFQTTGLEPGRHHRIVEVGVVMVDYSGEIETAWSTLINPQRDVGDTTLHGITARDVVKAPTFGDLLPHLLAAVSGRILVAHNPTFDLLFLHAELRRCGLVGGSPPVGLSTRDWFYIVNPGRGRRRLVDCCELAGINIVQRYSSEHQSLAVAELLQRYIKASDGSPPWQSTSEWMRDYPWPGVAAFQGDFRLRPRSRVEDPSPGSWLDRIAGQMPIAGLPLHDAYLEVLERALLDRYLAEHETQSLITAADELGLDRDDLRQIHSDYLTTMARVALVDGVLSDDERADLDRLAATLGLKTVAVDEALAAAMLDPEPLTDAGFRLEPADWICITGSTRTPRHELEAQAAGAGLACGGLTRRTKLLVAADPDSLSGKAKKARDFGIPIVTEDAFLPMVDCLRASQERALGH